ncbi:MAG: hypothetical protein KDK99_20155 [Verrucomicrobiales bacterium]|nr:hypothetical protein [Verrucomicrobiales bacterium]
MPDSPPSWLVDFLPLLRCPDTAQPLRLATAEECQTAQQMGKTALARQDGSRIFPIDQGIPLLLPVEVSDS